MLLMLDMNEIICEPKITEKRQRVHVKVDIITIANKSQNIIGLIKIGK